MQGISVFPHAALIEQTISKQGFPFWARLSLGLSSRFATFLNNYLSSGFSAKVSLCLLALMVALSAAPDGLLVNNSTAFAQSTLTADTSTNKTTPTPSSSKREAWMEASDYSVANPVVAFSVNGRAPNATNHQIAEYVKARLAERGVGSKYFTGQEDRMGVAFSFFINGHAYGPVSISKMMATIDEVAGHAKGVEYLRETGQPVP
jgi:hypothetical protein